MENKITRIDQRLDEEMEDIRRLRKELGIDKTKISDRAITNLIVRHKLWKRIKQDIITYEDE